MGEKAKEIIVSGMYGYDSREPLVQIDMPEESAGAPPRCWQVKPEEARDMAMNLMRAAEAAEQDAFLFEFTASEMKMGEQAGATMLLAYRRWRRPGQTEVLQA